MVLGFGPLGGLSAEPPRTDRSVESAGLTQQDFLKLIIAQMRNQNPLDPQSQSEFIGQMTQFTMLEQLETLNKSMEWLLLASSFSQASSLIGKSVQVKIDDAATANSVVARLEAADDGAIARIDGVPPPAHPPGEWTITTTKDGAVNAVFQPTDGSAPISVAGHFDEQGVLAGLIPGITLYERLVHQGGSDHVTFAPATQGIVERVKLEEGAPKLLVNGRWVGMSEVLEVGLAPAAPTAPPIPQPPQQQQPVQQPSQPPAAPQPPADPAPTTDPPEPPQEAAPAPPEEGQL